MMELKFTGNCLKGSRPLLSFDPTFESTPELQLMKEIFTQVFGTPKGHPKSKPFFDHVFSFYIADGKIWFRNYQIAEEILEGKTPERVLVEIGPRFVLDPIKIVSGSFSGAPIYENPNFISPNAVRTPLFAFVSRTSNTHSCSLRFAHSRRRRSPSSMPIELHKLSRSNLERKILSLSPMKSTRCSNKYKPVTLDIPLFLDSLIEL
jgi:hypothetical protein